MIQTELRKKARELVFKDMNLNKLKEDNTFGDLYLNIHFKFDGSPHFQEFVDYIDDMNYINTKLFDSYFEQYKIKDLEKFINKYVTFKLKKIEVISDSNFDESKLSSNDYCFKLTKNRKNKGDSQAKVYKYAVDIVLNPELDAKKRNIDVKKLVPKVLKWSYLTDEMDIYY